MTFTIRIRGANGPTVAEYECPLHGRFERIVERDANGDPPAEVMCDDLPIECDDDFADLQCLERAPHVISAPLFKPKQASVTTGKAEERPPGYLDTRALGEGMSMNEWRKQRAKLREERRKKRVMEFRKHGSVPT